MNNSTRAHVVYNEIQRIILEIRHFPDLATDTDDEVWKTYPLANRYRELLRIWWTLPNAEVSAVLYGSPSPTFIRSGRVAPATTPLLTMKGQPRLGWYPSHTELRVAKVTKVLLGTTDATK